MEKRFFSAFWFQLHISPSIHVFIHSTNICLCPRQPRLAEVKETQMRALFWELRGAESSGAPRCH